MQRTAHSHNVASIYLKVSSSRLYLILVLFELLNAMTSNSNAIEASTSVIQTIDAKQTIASQHNNAIVYVLTGYLGNVSKDTHLVFTTPIKKTPHYTENTICKHSCTYAHTIHNRSFL